jgi:uncharacterized repeat protein (TIGR02543 family)
MNEISNKESKNKNGCTESFIKRFFSKAPKNILGLFFVFTFILASFLLIYITLPINQVHAETTTPVVTAVTPSSQTSVSLNRILKLKIPRMKGGDIKTLQTFLNNSDYNCGITDGIFGPKTQAAVIAFQTANNLTPDGKVGKNTLAVINQSLILNSTSNQTSTSGCSSTANFSTTTGKSCTTIPVSTPTIYHGGGGRRSSVVNYSLTYTAGTNGSIIGTTPQTVNSGGSGTEVTATPDTGYHFVKWSDNNSTTVTRTDSGVVVNITSTASFAIDTYTVTFDKNTGDTEADPITKTVDYNNNVGILPTAPTKTGYTFNSWNTLANGTGSAFDATTAVIASITVYAKWTINTYTLTYSAGSNGTLTGTASQTVNYGEDGTLVTAVPDTGYHFVTWDDGVLTAVRTETNVTSTHSPTASFAIDTPNGDPSLLTLTVISDTQIDLAWTNGSTNEDGISIERSTDGITYAEITTVATGVSTYSNTGLTADTLYYYKVRAFKGGVYSEYSNIISSIVRLNLVIEGHSFMVFNGVMDYHARFVPNIYSVNTTGVSGNNVSHLVARQNVIDGYLIPETVVTKNVMLLWVGVNEVNGAGTGTTAYNNLKSYIQSRLTSGWEIYVYTMTPCSKVAPFESERIIFNNLMRNDLALLAGVNILDTDTEPQFNDYTDTRIYTDGLHLTEVGAFYAISLFENSLNNRYNYTAIGTSGVNLVQNSFDWTDANSNGIGDDFSIYLGTGSIVTGNGFTGNAQRVVATGTTTILYTGGYPLTLNQKYKITFKYRTNSVIIISLPTVRNLTLSIPANEGDAMYCSLYFTPTTIASGYSYFNINMQNSIGKYFEIDEFVVKKVVNP